MEQDKNKRKPTVLVADWNIEDMGGWFRLTGAAINHPRFENGERINTSQIVCVETRNTKYVLAEGA